MKVEDFFKTNKNIVYENIELVNKNITSLKGCPKEIIGDFDLQFNKLKNLQYCPDRVSGHLSINNNKIDNLNYFPKEVRAVKLDNNKLTSLKGLPKTVHGFLSVENNKIKKLDGELERVFGQFLIANNKLTSLKSENLIEVLEFYAPNNKIETFDLNFNIKTICDISHNNIEEIDNKQKLKFESLDLSNNLIKKISLNIQTGILNLENNRIEEIDIVGEVGFLNCKNNPIKKIKKLPKIKMLSISELLLDNNFDYDSLLEIKDKKTIETLVYLNLLKKINIPNEISNQLEIMLKYDFLVGLGAHLKDII
jgi:hypothetical protein